MALNIKNADVERLASEVARLTGESKTEAIRKALDERRRRLKGPSVAERRRRVIRLLETRIWPSIPKKDLGRRITRAEKERNPRLRTRGRMTLDTSALIAILLSEPGALDLVDRILEADVVRVGTPTLVETAVVLATNGGGRR